MSNEVIDPKEATFLIVDDDSQVRDILTQYLNSFGFDKVIQAKDGKAAVKIVQNHNQRIDFIISDWEMPHVDGLTLLKAVRKDPIRANVKFLMVSSQSSHERMKISKAAKSHVDAYLVKPFRANLLKDKINILMNGGIDESAAEFEAALNIEVPANNQLTRTGTVRVTSKPDKNAPAAVKSKKTEQLIGELKKMAAEELNSAPAKGKADTTKEAGELKDGEMPPETYDLAQMNIQAIVNLAKAYTKVKWFDKAIQLCNEALVLFPDNADLHFYIGQGYFHKADLNTALSFLKAAVKLQPYHVGAHSLINEINNNLQKTG
jgi:two-component system chemotaxis response regulator CheY